MHFLQLQAKQSLTDLLGGLEPRQYANMLTAANMKEALEKLGVNQNEEQGSIVRDITDSLSQSETLLHNAVLSTVAAAVVQVSPSSHLLYCLPSSLADRLSSCLKRHPGDSFHSHKPIHSG